MIHTVILTGGRWFTGLDRIRDDLRVLYHSARIDRRAPHTVNVDGVDYIVTGTRPLFVAHGANGMDKPWPFTISADALAHRAAHELLAEGLWIVPDPYPVDHTRDGQWSRAGNRRNSRMVRTVTRIAPPGHVLGPAYPDPGSTGTWHCAGVMHDAGIPVLAWLDSQAARDMLEQEWSPADLIPWSDQRVAIMPRAIVDRVRRVIAAMENAA